MKRLLILGLVLSVFLGCEKTDPNTDADQTDDNITDDIDLIDDDLAENDESQDDQNDEYLDIDGPDRDIDSDSPCSPNPCDIENSTGECVETDDSFECVCEENYLWDGENCVVLPTKVFVNINAVGLSNGTSWKDAYPELQRAISESPENSEIWVAKGTYKPTGMPNDLDLPEPEDPNYPRYRHFTLRNTISVFGGFSGDEAKREQRDPKKNETILSGDMDSDGEYSSQDLFHVFFNYSLDSSAVLDGFTITGGNADLDVSTELDHHEQHGGGMFNHFSANPDIYNCKFTKNYALVSGGAMENRDSDPYIDNCFFEDNVSFRGGGINNNNASPRIFQTEFSNNTTVKGYGGAIFNDEKSRGFFNECLFSGNTSEDGGAISNNVFSDVRILNCIFENNKAERNGGAITNSESKPIIWFSTFKGNEAVSGGGAIESYSDSEPKIVGCKFYNNKVTTSGDGGAILTTTGKPIVVSSVFYDNSAPSGGAISNRDTEIYLINSTFVHNSADPVSGYGGAIYSQTNSHTNIINSIIWENYASGDNTGSEIYNEIAETDIKNSDIKGCLPGGVWDDELGDNKGGNIDSNPSFTDMGSNDFSLKAGSDCIDTGDNAEYEMGGLVYSFQEDVDENTRIVNDKVDIGAWEFQK